MMGKEVECTADSIVKVLDKILLESLSECKSVLISGPTGTGKSYCVNEWLNMHKEFGSATFLANCNSDVIKEYLENGKLIANPYGDFYFCDNELDYFKENQILFIEHFDLTGEDARRHLMHLVKNHEAKRGINGEMICIDNLKMIIAISFEIGSSHFGYTPLSKDDINAFDYVIKIKY